MRQEFHKIAEEKNKKFSHASHPQSLLSCEADMALYSNLMFKPIHDFDVISEECLQIFALPYTSPFHINYFFSPTCLQYLLMPIYYFHPAWGGGAAYHLLALSAVLLLLLLLLVLLLRLVQLLWSPHLFELSALIHLHGY